MSLTATDEDLAYESAYINGKKDGRKQTINEINSKIRDVGMSASAEAMILQIIHSCRRDT